MFAEGVGRNAVRRVRAVAMTALVALLAIGAAAAQTPLGVEYLPRDGAAIVYWMAPAGNVTGYHVYQQVVTTPGTQPADRVKLTADPIKETSLTIPNLTNGTAYRFLVSAIVDGKESDAVGPAPARDGDSGATAVVVPHKATPLGGGGEFYGHTIGTDYPGSHTVAADGTIAMKASGHDIWGKADGLYFLAMRMAGDVTITVRCVSGPTVTPDGNTWQLGGPMIRESVDARSRFALTQINRAEDMAFTRRAKFGAEIDDAKDYNTKARADNEKRPFWVRLQRTGDEFHAWFSEDGATWVEIGTGAKIDGFAKEAFVGLSLSAREESEYTTAVFDNFKITSP
jgi:Fibronectin type III domain